MKNLPDFATYQDRDKWFAENADYFSVVKKAGVGNYARDEKPTLEEARKLAQTKITIGGGNYMIYAVVGEQSAFVEAVKGTK